MRRGGFDESKVAERAKTTPNSVVANPIFGFGAFKGSDFHGVSASACQLVEQMY
jgi:hypothetical protein